MNISESKEIETTLQKAEIHQHWEDWYRTEENEKFYELAFDSIARLLKDKENSTFLDVGCGIGAHSVRLAKRGFSVIGVDFSESVLKSAKPYLQESGLADKIKLQRDNILDLSFADGTFDCVLCWGVLMHIPEIEKALAELDRVLKKGGILIISEGNMHSFQSVLQRWLNGLLGKEKAIVKKTKAGLEYWRITPSGRLLTRQANTQWIKNEFKSRGFTIKKHMPGQFTELYTKLSSASTRRLIHFFNNFWFQYAKNPRWAFGNIIILEKQD